MVRPVEVTIIGLNAAARSSARASLNRFCQEAECSRLGWIVDRGLSAGEQASPHLVVGNSWGRIGEQFVNTAVLQVFEGW